MDLSNYVSKASALDDNEIERISQECSKRIVFALIDQKEKLPEKYETDCEALLAEFRKRFMAKIDKDLKRNVHDQEK